MTSALDTGSRIAEPKDRQPERCFPAGYQVSLVGRDQELKVSLTATLGTARHRAEEVAAEVDRRSAISYKGSGGTL